MSGSPEPESRHRNGNGRHGLLAGLSDKLIRALPPAFLLLLILNAGFLFAILWVVQHNSDQRNVLLTKIVEGCLTDQKGR
jgi:hypothetical protein